MLRKASKAARVGWEEAARKIAEAGEDELVMGEFGNAEDVKKVGRISEKTLGAVLAGLQEMFAE